jgi:hypothetical protein
MAIDVCLLACTISSFSGVNNEVEIIHADSLTHTTTDAPLLGGHDDMICLSGRDLASFESLEEALFPFL